LEDLQKPEDEGKADAKGPLELNESGYCVHGLGGKVPPHDGDKLIMFKQCLGEDRLHYTFSDGFLRHPSSGKCVGLEGKHLVFSKDCKEKFEMKNKKIIHESGKCVAARPVRENKLQLADECNSEKWAIMVQPRNVRKNLPKPIFVKERVKKVAISILITSDPGEHSGFLDSAGALVMSIRDAKISYDYDLIAIISPKVVKARPVLQTLGFEILVRELPVQADEIRDPNTRREILKDGCCGIDELLKLHAWTLTDYERVLQIDADILFHQNFDELFEYDATLTWTHGGLGGTEPLNGGFLVIRPDLDDYNEMVEIIKEGDYRSGRGWRGVCCWVYGGRTIQGMLPFFYIHHKKERNIEIDRCKYNNMVEIDRCKSWTYDHVTSNHFTVCEKPFHCRRSTELRSKLCANFTNHWWEMTHKLESELGLPRRKHCDGGYTQIEWAKASKKLQW